MFFNREDQIEKKNINGLNILSRTLMHISTYSKIIFKLNVVNKN